MKNPFIICLVLIFFGCFNQDRPPLITGLEGKPMPSFNLLLRDSSQRFNTSNIPAGRPTVLFYFHPNCTYCRAQTADIVKEIDKLKNIQLCLITDAPYPDMMMFNDYYHLSKFSNVTIGVDTSYSVAEYFQVPGVPYTAIYDAGKKLKRAFVGKLPSQQLIDITSR